MDKEKFLKWLEVKQEEVIAKTPESLKGKEQAEIYLKGTCDCMKEITNQVKSGKFDEVDLADEHLKYQIIADNVKSIVLSLHGDVNENYHNIMINCNNILESLNKDLKDKNESVRVCCLCYKVRDKKLFREDDSDKSMICDCCSKEINKIDL